MKQLSTIKKNSMNSLKLVKLKHLLQNSKKSNTKILLANKMEKSNLSNSSQKVIPNLVVDLSRDLPLYLSIIEKPVNLLFSIDQFLFEFSKKTYQQKKTGEFFQQLKERKKLSLFYGHLTKKQLAIFFNKVKKNKGYFYKNVFSLLERRLDVVIYRTGFTKTIAEARQIIKHSKILVNQKLVNVPSYLLNPGDLVSISPETMNTLKIQLLNGVKARLHKNHPNFFGDFYSRLIKILEGSYEKPTNNSKDLNLLTTHKNFQSKMLCNLLIGLLCTRIKLRCFWDLRKNLFDKSFTLSSSSILNNFNTNFLEKNVLTLFKRKSFSISGKKSRKDFYQKNSYRSKNDQQTGVYASKGSFQKKPLFWSRSLINFKQTTTLSFKNQRQNLRDKKNLKILNSKKRNLAFYRKSFLIFLKNLENSKKFTSLLSLNLKKSLFKRSFFEANSLFSLRKKNQERCSFYKTMNFRVIKPIHLEVSYNLLNIIYLYSPQRLNFPFFIDLDLINRSLR